MNYSRRVGFLPEKEVTLSVVGKEERTGELPGWFSLLTHAGPDGCPELEIDVQIKISSRHSGLRQGDEGIGGDLGHNPRMG